METKILSKDEQPILSRTKVDIEISFDKQTPSNIEIKAAITKLIGADEKLIVLQGNHTNFGERKSLCTIYQYKDQDSMVKIEGQTSTNSPDKKTEENSENDNPDKPKEEVQNKEKK